MSQKPQSARRGLLFITGAKLWFMVGGALLSFLLPRFFPKDVSRIRYGEWGFVLSAVSPINNVMITATLQAVSRFASRGAGWVGATQRSALKMHVFFGAVLGLLFFACAPWIAGFEKDPSLTPALRIAAGVIVAYSFYAVFTGTANGTRAFHKQAGLDASFTALRTGLVFLGALIFSTVEGAVAGFVAAAVTVLVLSVFVVGLEPVGVPTAQPAEAGAAGGEASVGHVGVPDLLKFILPVGAYLLITNTLMFVDGWGIKRMVAEHALALGTATPAQAAQLASSAVGLYTACQAIARIPYQAILAVTFVVFPLVSQATFASDVDRTRSYIDRAMRLSFLVVAAMAAALASHPGGPLSLFPRGEYLPGSAALATLGFGYVAFAMLIIAGTILNSSGATTQTLSIAAFTLLLDLGCTWFSIHWALAHGRDALLAAAIATTTSISLGVVVMVAYLHRRFGASLKLPTLLRTAVAVAVTIAAGRAIPLAGKAGLLAVIAGGLIYLAVLFATRELTVDEVKGLLRRD